ncbi:MAG: hypothetical protein UY99_C0012G0013 [Parcubacteria group bacterium GW2011_GWA1_59_11]|nr:MAG: hypothetical protein UY99_C0012G0013 [Parcubacteria group bacterium GW2011_GWA1_59_11]
MAFITAYLGFVGLLLVVLVLLLTEYRAEVKPASALVYNNQWTGATNALLPGTHFLVPGVHKRLEEVTLRNEAKNPSNVMLFTGDGIELEVDYIIRRQQVWDPGVGTFNADGGWQPIPLEQLRGAQRGMIARRAVMAATAINYRERDDKIQTRIVAALQAELDKKRYNQLFMGADLATGEAGLRNDAERRDIEQKVNDILRQDICTTEWGFVIQMDLEDYDLPERLRKAREQKVSAQMEGTALKEKLDALGAGNDPELKKWLVIGEVVGDALGRTFGGKGKKDK